jgi:hypothetical protein
MISVIKIDTVLAKKVLDYLISKNMGFCYLENGIMISREDCLQVLGL